MTAALIVVEIDDLASAANSMYGDVATPLARNAKQLAGGLARGGAIAGSDPGGTAWASAYDSAAGVALGAALDLTNAAYQVAAMFGQTARNWANAESASTPNRAGHIVSALAGLPSPTSVPAPGRVPSALGGSAPAPAGWDLVAALVHYVWPDGHQDLLRASASAWQASADTLHRCGAFATFADVAALADRLPEADGMNSVCQGLCRHLRTVADVHRSLGRACDGLAARIDEVRHEIVDELESLAEWTAGIQAAGLLFGAVTAGTSILGAQGIEVARISRTAVRVSAMIARFTDSARTVCEAIPTVAAVVESISTSLAPLLGTRLAIAGVTSVRGMPAVRRAVETAEMAADRRLVAGAAGGRGLGVGAQTWADRRTLQEHFASHGRDFGSISAEQYARQANAFLHRAVSEHLPMKIDAQGTIRIFDPAANIFGSYTRFRAHPDVLQTFERHVLGASGRSAAMSNGYLCPVCGYPDLTEAPRVPGSGGSYEICPSCGFEFGYTDEDLGISDVEWRTRWKKAGSRWSAVSVAPPDAWDPATQLRNVDK